MKKYISFLLCFVMVILLISCNNRNINEKESDHANSDTNDDTSEILSDNTEKESSVDYSKILYLYHSIIKIFPDYLDSQKEMDQYCSEFGIVDEEEKELFKKIFGSAFLFKQSQTYEFSFGYAIKDLNDDGVDELVLLNNEYHVIAIFSYADGKPVLLSNYIPRGSCWIDGDGLLHENGSGGAYYSANAVYKIADGGAELELIVEFGTNGHEWIGDVAYTKYYKLVNGEEAEITETEFNDLIEQYGKYLGSVAGATATKEHSGLQFIPIITKSEIAMEMFESAIHDEITVIDERLGETSLKNLRFSNGDTSLDACKLLKKAALDVDHDGVDEFVIQSPDYEQIILRCYNDKVYSYRLDMSDFYRFNMDGTFYWYHSSEAQGWACGLSKIVFDGETMNITPIYGLQYSENPTKYEYFVEGKPATESEYGTYRANNKRYEKIKFSQFEMMCSYPITAEQAWNLANAYWDNQDGRTDGSAGSTYTAGIVLIDTPNSETDSYRFAFQVERNVGGGMEGYECMPPQEISVYDQILVNAFTGEITASTYDPNGKAISVAEAIKIAKAHMAYADGDGYDEGKYCFEHFVNATAPDHIYVIAIYKYEAGYYSYRNSTWIDKNTGDVVFQYYVNGK